MTYRLNPESDVPLYLQLSRRLRSAIEGGKYRDGDLLPSELELCREYAISRYTVRQALNELENHGLVERVRGKGTFVRIPVAKSRTLKEQLASGTGVLGLVVPYLTDFYVSDIVRGAEQAATSAGYQLLLRNSHNDSQQETELIEELSGIGLDGLIVFPSDKAVTLPALDRVLSRGIPCVTVDRMIYREEVPAVVSDNVGGARAAVEHLISLGHSNIAFVSTPCFRTHTIWDRLVGYRIALERHGLPDDNQMYVFHTTRALEEANESDVLDLERLFDSIRESGATAVFAVNDLVALDVLAACRQFDCKVPEDLAVVGFDDIDLVAHLEVPLTTVAQQKTEMGRQAVSCLLDMIHGKRTGEIRTLPTQLIVRKSCGSRVESYPAQARWNLVKEC